VLRCREFSSIERAALMEVRQLRELITQVGHGARLGLPLYRLDRVSERNELGLDVEPATGRRNDRAMRPAQRAERCQPT
jgi:hypothetical protein